MLGWATAITAVANAVRAVARRPPPSDVAVEARAETRRARIEARVTVTLARLAERAARRRERWEREHPTAPNRE